MNRKKQLIFKEPEFVKKVAPILPQCKLFLEERTDLKIEFDGEKIVVEGTSHFVDTFHNFLKDAYFLLNNDLSLFEEGDIYDVLNQYLLKSSDTKLDTIVNEKLYISTYNRVISPKSLNQQKYIKLMKEKPVVFAVGPAGTGKTYLAMAMAVYFLKTHKFKKIVLTRPAVEAGEKLGFLPGDIMEKVNPYLRPLFDALYDMMDVKKGVKLINDGVLEVAPIAFMRGRTLNDSFVILDEAQNTTIEQMKMFLTRIGFNTKAVITGDITQIDLGAGVESGLVHALKILKKIEEIGIIYLDKIDIVRHPVVQKIVDAYEKGGNRTNNNKNDEVKNG